MTRLMDLMDVDTYAQCGLYKLTPGELAVLEKWAVHILGVQESSPLLGTCISAVMPGGRTLELDDGSLWLVRDEDAPTVDGWCAGDEVAIAGERIYRLKDADAAYASCLREGNVPSSVSDDPLAGLSTAQAVARLIRQLPQRLNRSSIDGESFVIQYCLQGEGGGDYYLAVREGEPDTREGRFPMPTMTMTLDAQDFVELITGCLDGSRALLEGRIKLSGDSSLASRMGEMLRA